MDPNNFMHTMPESVVMVILQCGGTNMSFLPVYSVNIRIVELRLKIVILYNVVIL